MNIFDRLALNSLIKTVLNFILTIVKIFMPVNSDKKPILKRRNRRNKTDE